MFFLAVMTAAVVVGAIGGATVVVKVVGDGVSDSLSRAFGR
jgi:hypothetical protein